jgi:hypothetical protein
MNGKYRSIIFLALAVAVSCKNSTEPPASLAITIPASFSATVSQIAFEEVVGPAGRYSQYDVRVVIPPAATVNAGVVVSKTTPVFQRIDNRIVASSASEIREGDRVEVWYSSVAYGAVQGPAGAPTYLGTQIVISR